MIVFHVWGTGRELIVYLENLQRLVGISLRVDQLGGILVEEEAKLQKAKWKKKKTGGLGASFVGAVWDDCIHKVLTSPHLSLCT